MLVKNNKARKQFSCAFFCSLLLSTDFAPVSTRDVQNSNRNSNNNFSVHATFLHSVGAHVLHFEPKCTSLNFVYFTTKETLLSKIKIISTVIEESRYSTLIILTSSPNWYFYNTTQNETTGPPEKLRYIWSTKYQAHCSIGVLTPNSIQETKLYLSSRNEEVRIPQQLPGAPHKVFYIVWGMRELNQLELQGTRFIQNLIFASEPESEVPNNVNDITIMTRNWNRENLNEIGIYKIKESQLALTGSSGIRDNLFQKLPDYEGNEFHGLDSPFGVDVYTHFEEHGEWLYSNIATLYYLSTDLNATFKISPEYSKPTDGKDENDKWDGYTEPLVQGSMIFAGIVTPTIIRHGVIYLSTPYMFDSVSFIHALPKKGFFGRSLTVLQHPLENLVWIGILFSIILTILALEFILWFKKTNNMNCFSKKPYGFCCNNDNPVSISMSQNRKLVDTIYHLSKTTIVAVLKPIMDQNGLINSGFKKEIQNHYSRFIIGIWFLSLIVLGCAYKSKLISAIVLPNFIYPPRTFKELLDSDFKIGVVLWEVWSKHFQGVHNMMGETIVERAEELSYMNPEDFHLIFNGKQAIVGLTAIFNALAGSFLTDVNKRPLYMKSKDSYFTMLGSLGFSPHHPYCIEPANHYLSVFASSGLSTYWSYKNNEHFQKQGQSQAKQWSQTMKEFCSRTEDDKETAGSQYIWLLCLIMGYGSLVAILSFVGEWILHITIAVIKSKRKQNLRSCFKASVLHTRS